MQMSILVGLLGLVLAAANSLGAISAKTVMHEDGSSTQTVTNPEAGTSQSIQKDASGNVLQRVLYRLDATGQPDAGIVYDPKGRILYKMKLKRDAQNRVIEQTDFSAKDVFVRRMVFTYDNLDRLAKVETYDEAGTLVNSSSATLKKRPSRR